VLSRGKHVACAVPAVFGSIEDAYRLLEAVKNFNRKKDGELMKIPQFA
jgi:hypothetical protein